MTAPAGSEWWTLLERSVHGRLSAVSAAVRGAGRAESAWEALVARDLVPLEWASTSARAFVPRWLNEPCRCAAEAQRATRRGAPARLCAVCARGGGDERYSPVPSTPEDLIAFALNPTAIAAAEALAFEVAARLGVRASPERRVLWRFLTGPSESVDALGERHPLRRGDALGACVLDFEETVTCVSDADARIAERHKQAFRAASAQFWGPPLPAPRHLGAGAAWRAGQELVGRPPPASDAPGAGGPDAMLAPSAAYVRDAVAAALARGDWYSDQLAETVRHANPFEPALAIWQLGCGIEAVSERAVVLVAPSFRA